MTTPALSSVALSSSGAYLASSYGEHLAPDCRVRRRFCGVVPHQQDALQRHRHRLSAALSEAIIEAAPIDLVTKDKEKGNRGKGGRRSPKVRPGGAAIDTSNKGPKLGWLKQEGVDLTSERTIWRINRAIGRCSSVTEALGVIEEMKAAGLTSANEGTYLALITVCRKQRQGERALSILEVMKQAGVRPGMLTYNTLISCCQQALRLEDAFRIKAEMETAGIKPDVVTYTSLMALLVKADPYRGRSTPTQRLQKVMDLYKEMTDSNVQPDAITFNTLMYAGSQAKLPEKVLETYRTMISAGVSPNQFTFSILLESIGAGGRLKSALEVFNEMRAAGISPQTSTYNFLIEACAAAPQPNAKKAWALFEEMKKVEDVAPNAITFVNLIAASSKGGDHPGAIKAYDQMMTLGFSEAKTTSTFNKLIHAVSIVNGLDSAFQTYEKMRVEGYKPDVITYSTLLSACARADDLQKALAVGEEFEKMGIPPNQGVLHALIGAFGKAGRWEDAVITFRSMNKEQEKPTIVSYSIVFDACLGKDGTDVVMKRDVGDGVLQMNPGFEAAIQLYKGAVEGGLFKNYSLGDLSRCDLRSNTRSAIVVAVLAWLEDVRRAPPTTDLVVVVGTNRGKEPAKSGTKNISWKYGVADKTLKAVGLQSEQMNTITMQALTVKSQILQAWLSS